MPTPLPTPLPQVIVTFVDIRGFTRWADKTEVAPHLRQFLEGFEASVRTHFHAPDEGRRVLKTVGDGAALLRELSASDDPDKELVDHLARIAAVEKEFEANCAAFAKQYGVGASLRLGWGIVRGNIISIRDDDSDYTGTNMNKAARLCDMARPSGIAIDAEDFSRPSEQFEKQRRTLPGLGKVPVWVTKEIADSFLRREVLHESPEVHIAGVCIDRTRVELRILVARRAPDRALYPGLFEGCGGQLASGESFTDGVIRHFRGDFGIQVRVHEALHNFYKIETAGHIIPGIRFLCERVGTRAPKRGKNHEKVEFVSLREFEAIPDEQFIPGLKDEALALVRRHQQSFSEQASAAAAANARPVRRRAR